MSNTSSKLTTKRYSGDAEIRVGYDRETKSYVGRVTDPYLRFRGWVSRNPRFSRNPTSSEAYDDAARRIARYAQAWAKSEQTRFMVEEDKRGRVRIRRGFQAPCPLEDL